MFSLNSGKSKSSCSWSVPWSCCQRPRHGPPAFGSDGNRRSPHAGSNRGLRLISGNTSRYILLARMSLTVWAVVPTFLGDVCRPPHGVGLGGCGARFRLKPSAALFPWPFTLPPLNCHPTTAVREARGSTPVRQHRLVVVEHQRPCCGLRATSANWGLMKSSQLVPPVDCSEWG